jgi:hypothetical protein
VQGFPLPRVSRPPPRNIKARLPDFAPQRSKCALMQTPFACGQGFAPTPHAPIPTGNHPAERRPRRSRGRSGDRHGRLRSGGRNRRPAVRRGSRAAGVGRKRRRVAPREPHSATTLAPPSRKSLLGQIWGLYGPISLSPRAPLSQTMPDLATVPMADIPPRWGGCAHAVAASRSLACALLFGIGSFRSGVHVCCCEGFPVRPHPLRLRATARAGG